jgi:hypothetical protein
MRTDYLGDVLQICFGLHALEHKLLATYDNLGSVSATLHVSGHGTPPRFVLDRWLGSQDNPRFPLMSSLSIG